MVLIPYFGWSTRFAEFGDVLWLNSTILNPYKNENIETLRNGKRDC